MKQSAFLRSLIVALASVLCAATSAFAVESYSLPGTACVNSVGQGNGYFYVSSSGGLACPIVRRSPDVSTVFVNATVSSGTSCFAIACPEGGTSATCDYGSTSTASGSGFSTLSLDFVIGYSNGAAGIYCYSGSGANIVVMNYRWSD